MKKKIYYLVLLLSLIFTAGCNKETEQPDPTPAATATATPTPTPTPANLAKTNIDKLPELFDTLMSYQPENSTDYSNGAGYDVTVKLSIGQQIVDLLGLAGLENIHASGTVDIKEALAANMSLYLNDSEVLNAHVFADGTNLLYNLPKYASNYAAISWQEMLNTLEEENIEAPADDSSLTGSGYEVIRTINTVDQSKLPNNEELTNLLRTYLKEFADCFLAVPGITENVSIGNGEYILTGEKHTVKANIEELYAILESLEAELQNYAEITFEEEDYRIDGATSFLLDYYISENGDYAWAAYPDNSAAEPLVFINTSLGFCLYSIQEDASADVAMYSVKTSEAAGTITIPSSDDSPEDVITYETGENNFSMYAVFDTTELTLEASKISDTIRYNVTVVSDGVSVVLKETMTSTHTDLSCSLASYGVEYLTLSVTTDARDYVEIPVPQNTVSAETWAEELDQDALLADVMMLMQDYPFLLQLFLGSEEDSEDGWEDDSWNNDFWGTDEEEPFVVPEDYTDEFSSMTGYAIDSWGYVDFTPEESEVLALGKPSTGMDTMKITEDQKKALIDYASKAYASCDSYVDKYYWVWGSVEYKDVRSYYTETYAYYDNSNYDNGILIEFDAISGELSSVDVYNKDKETTLRMVNDILKLLNVDYTITAKAAEEYTFVNNLSFYGYDASEYGDDYYEVSFSVYNPE